MRKIKILFVCGAGLGSSFACQMTTEDVLKKLNINNYELEHSDISSCLSLKPNIIITAENFKINLKNLMFKRCKNNISKKYCI